MRVLKDFINHKTLNENIIIDNGSIMYNHGIIEGNIEIINNSKLINHGIIKGHIMISKNSSLIIHGIVQSNIMNNGYCQLFGYLYTDYLPTDIVKELNSKIFPLS